MDQKKDFYGIIKTIVILGLFAAFFTIILERGNSFLQFHLVPISWQKAKWITFPGGSEVLYVRKSFNLSSIPNKAYLQLAAIDNFQVYINNKLLEKKVYEGERVSGIYDIAAMLKLGRNLIAINSISRHRNIDAQIIAEIYWNILGKEYIIFSRNDWLVKKKEIIQRHGISNWKRIDFYDKDWPLATLVSTKITKKIRSSIIPFFVMKKMVATNWWWHNNLYSNHTNLMRSLDIDTKIIYGAWLGISINGNYSFRINNFIFPKEIGIKNKMKVFSIASYLIKGTNNIVIQAYNENNELPKIAITGGVYTPDGWINFSLNKKWQCTKNNCEIILVKPINNNAPQIIISSLNSPMNYILQHWQNRLNLWVTVFLSTLIPAFFFMPLFKLCGINLSNAWNFYGQPYNLTTFLLILFFIADFDPRWNFASLYFIYIPIIVIVFITIGLFLPIIECLWRDCKVDVT